MQISQRSLFVGLVLALALAGCTLVPTSKVGEGQACTDDGRCASGYVCNRIKNACIKDDGSGCVDADKDGVTTCEHDCDDSNATCTTDCTDADSDGTCVTNDCDDNEPRCAADCVTDSDSDTILDCLDTCVDADGDGIGTGINGNSSCRFTFTLVIDSNDQDQAECADTDKDGCDDCVSGGYDPADDGVDSDEDGLCDAGDTCVDVDKDGVGNGTLGNAGCDILDDDDDDSVGSDCADTDMDGCDDCSVAGRWAPSNDGDDNDSDGICDAGDEWDDDQYQCGDSDGDSCDDCTIAGHWAPANDGTDEDGDGFCLNGSSGDCDDTLASCTTDCTDLDGDSVPDCGDDCVDIDDDDHGVGPGCVGGDCWDYDDSCAVDCAGCMPSGLALTVDSPVSASTCEPSTLAIDLQGYAGAADELVCESVDYSVLGPASVAYGGFPQPWTDRSTGGDVSIEPVGEYGFNADTWCGQDEKAIVIKPGGSYYLATQSPLDMTGWKSVRVRFAVAYAHGPPEQDDLEVYYCCGVPCTMELAGTIYNASDGGTDTCRSETVALPFDVEPEAHCAALQIRFEWASGSAEALLADMEVLADLTVSSFTEASAGMYEATVASCQAVSVPVACYWPNATNPGRTDIKTIEWE